MQLAVFCSTDEGGFAPGWANEIIVLLFGSAKLDLTKRPPAPDARLTVIAIFGGAKIIVPAGTSVIVGGFSLFGSREVKARAGDGPNLSLQAFVSFGGVEVVEAPGGAIGDERQADAARRRPTFPF